MEVLSDSREGVGPRVHNTLPRARPPEGPIDTYSYRRSGLWLFVLCVVEENNGARMINNDQQQQPGTFFFQSSMTQALHELYQKDLSHGDIKDHDYPP